jgi:tRNA threonylcarbamoyladenosine biosynthesis protein TsaB
MILIINTIERNKIEVGLFKNNILKCFEFETSAQSEDLLAAIEGILKNAHLTLKNIKKILVNLGPGSYTGVRVGATVANTLGWILDIGVFGFRDGELEKTLPKISKNKKSKFSKIVLPYYQ